MAFSQKSNEIFFYAGSSLVAHLSTRDNMTAVECATHAIDLYSAGLDTVSEMILDSCYFLHTYGVMKG